MCEIDWVALGTWAAVVTALAIAVEDKITRRLRLRSERVAMAAMIRADLHLARSELRRLLAYVAPDDGNDNVISDLLLHGDGGMRRQVSIIGAEIDAPAIRDAASRLQAFDPDTTRAIADCSSMLRALRKATDGFNAEIVEELDQFEESMRKFRVVVRTTLRLVDNALAALAPHHG